MNECVASSKVPSLLLLSVFLSTPRNAPQVTCANLRHRTLVLHDLHGTVQRAFVLVSFETLSERTHTGKEPCQHLEPGRPRDPTHLHSGLDDVEGSVSEHAGGASDGSERTGYHGVNGFVGVIPLVIHKKTVILELRLGHECVTTGSYTPLYQFLSTVMT